jgi:hypothetical protein
MNKQDLSAEVQRLDLQAADILRTLTTNPAEPNPETIDDLDRIASAAARLVYGNDRPGLLSERLANLISWCDHLDDPTWTAEFRKALRTEPLRAPWRR